MANSDYDIGELSRRRQTRLGLFLRLRRKQLGLRLDDMGRLIKRRRCKHFDRIESGQDYLHSQEYPYVEQALQLPPDFIDQLVRMDSPYGEASAQEILQQLSTVPQEEPDAASSLALNICNSCARQVLRLLERYPFLQITRQRIHDKNCVCGGQQRSDADILLRMALMLSKARSLVMLGGSESIKLACKDVPNMKITIALGDKKAGKHMNSSTIANLDLIIVVRGEVTHATTAPYLNLLKGLPSEKQPIVLRPHSSNITGIAEEILTNLNKIIAKAGHIAR